MSGAGRAGPPAALYEGIVVHRRRGLVEDGFRRRVWMPLLDLDRLDEARGVWPLWSTRRAAVVRHRRQDYGAGRADGAHDPRPLAQTVRDLVEERTGVRPQGPVRLLAHARTWGWLFNPLAVYFCSEPDGEGLLAAVLEVTNTPWGERHQYVLDLRDGASGGRTVDKRMHVSPFLPMDVSYDIRLSPPGERCSVTVTVRRGETVVLSTAMVLHRRRFSTGGLVGMLLRHPFLTHRVSAGIYAHALRLRRMGVPYLHRPTAAPGPAAQDPG